MWKSNDKRWLFFFIPFLTLVVGLMLYLHLFGQPAMNHEGHGFLAQYKGIAVIDSTPGWVAKDYAYISGKMSSLPKAYQLVSLDPVEAPDLCTSEVDGEKLTYPCKKGWVTVTSLTTRMLSCTEDCKGGKSVWDVSDPKNPTCTIFIPNDIQDVLPLEQAIDIDELDIRSDIENISLAHEYVHCIRGKGHVTTDLPGPFTSDPTGALMHRNILKAGWSAEGL